MAGVKLPLLWSVLTFAPPRGSSFDPEPLFGGSPAEDGILPEFLYAPLNAARGPPALPPG